MREIIAKTALILLDILIIFLSVVLATLIQGTSSGVKSIFFSIDPLLLLLHTTTLIVLYWEGVYTKRYDFWQEYHRIVRAIFIACIVVLALLALGNAVHEYSRFVVLISFISLLFFLPLGKYLLKRWLYKIKIWGREALMIGEAPFFEHEVFGNPYLGYIRAKKESAKTLFIASENRNVEEIEMILDDTVEHKQEVIFIPLIKSYDFSDSYIIHIFHAHTNLIVLENKLLNSYNRGIKKITDYLLSLMLFPIALVVMGVIALKIKLAEPSAPVMFFQKRLGKNGIPFCCYKFRTMCVEGEKILAEYLAQNPYEIQNYEMYHKYDNDPRITPIGRFLRKTSLDELPQILNVIRGEMSLIGPRPYMIDEKEAIGEKTSLILAVEPGITGMWQVSGRSDVDFESRLELDAWYVRNWSLWTDFVILVKTIKVVFQRKGAI